MADLRCSMTNVCTLQLPLQNTRASPFVPLLPTHYRERVQLYYTLHIRRWKRALPRTGSDALRVRLLFRIAHFQEFRGKAAKAAKYYSLVRLLAGMICAMLSYAWPSSHDLWGCRRTRSWRGRGHRR